MSSSNASGSPTTRCGTTRPEARSTSLASNNTDGGEGGRRIFARGPDSYPARRVFERARQAAISGGAAAWRARAKGRKSC
jgi:hypothetical protein